MIQPANFSSWWGRHTTQSQRADFWQIGPLRLWIDNLPNRLKLTWTTGTDWLDGHVRNVAGSQVEPPPADAQTLTCAFTASGNNQDLVFSPGLPDRAVIVKLSTPTSVLPGEEVTLFFLTPLSLRVELAQPVKLLGEFPLFRLSDTWFGPMSSMGSLCFSSPSPAYLDLREVPLRPHCAITAMTIKNSGSTSLNLERINVPFTRLSLFYSARTGFWTDRITLERREDNEMANIKLDRQPPAEASPTQFITGPRAGVAESIPVVRAFSNFFRSE